MTKSRKISLSELLSSLVETWVLGSGKVFPSPLLDRGDSLSCDCSSVIRETEPRSVCPATKLRLSGASLNDVTLARTICCF